MALPEIIINGNATRDAVAGTSKDGRRYLFVTVAQNKSRKLEDGTWEDVRSIFFDVAYWDVPADITIPKKGDRVKAAGQLYTEMEEYEGQQRMKVRVDAYGMRVFRNENSGWPNQQQDQGQQQGQQHQQHQPQGGFGQGQQQPQQQGQGQQQSYDPWNSAPAQPPANNNEPPF